LSAADEREVVAVAPRQRRADEWALVLQAEGLDAAVRRGREGWLVETRRGDAAHARALLDAFERENQPAPARALAPLPPFPLASAAAASIALLWLFAWTGPRAGGSAWFAAGSARAARIVALGEWWRALTALTLHADLGHVLGNVLAGSLFGGSACARFGTGVGAALLVAAGALGNLANAFYHRASGHDSVGASTAVFGAIGLLAADALVAGRMPRGGRLAPFGAALGLLAMLGTSQRADFGAHLFGLAAGFALGVPAARLLPAAPRLAWQALAGAAAAAALTAAWTLALR